MKMVKKILLGLSVIAIAVSLTGCIKDDTESAIKGVGKNYSIDYTNDNTENYRAYKASGQKHAGGIVKITFDKDGDPADSKMGVIFGLEETKTADKKTIRNFNIIGVSAANNYYVSSFKNIENIQDKNFGATENAATGPSEKVWKSLGTSVTLPANEGNKFAYIWYKANINGSYDWAILDLTEEQLAAYDTTTGAKPAGATVLASGTITEAFTAVTAEKDLPQHQISVYAMIQPGKTLSGKWNIVGTYKEAEDAE